MRRIIKSIVGVMLFAMLFVLFSWNNIYAGNVTLNFNNAGQTGGTGPTQAQVDSAYSGTVLTGKVTVRSINSISGIQEWTVPYTGTYIIEAAGAQGGRGNYNGTGGSGAKVRGTFNLNQGDKLRILVGQKGTDTSGNYGDGTTGAGGGGTFVAKIDPNSSYTMADGTKVTPLLAAGGGNGGRDIGYSGSGSIFHGLATAGSDPGTASYAGGSFAVESTSSTGQYSGRSFLNGGAGATYVYSRGHSSTAGYGGGGSNTDDGDGGGGGGWFGGVRGSRGPGSYNADPSGTNTAGVNAGNGYVSVTYDEVTVNVSSPTNGQTVPKGTSINFQWSGTSPYGNISNYTLQIGTTDGGTNKVNKPEGTKTSDTIDISNLTVWPSGTYYWQVIAADSTGKNGVSKGTIVINNTKPTVTIGSIAANKYSAVSGYEKLRLSGTVQDLNKDTAVKVYYRIDGTQWTGTQIGGNIAATGGNDVFAAVDIPVGSYSEGQHTLFVWANDGVENSTEASLVFSIDKSAPTSPSIRINNDTQYANSVPMNLTISSVNAAKMFISRLSTTPTISSVNTTGTSTGWVGYTTSYAWSTAPQDGSFILYVWFMDDVGNISTSASDAITYKAIAPAAPTIVPSATTLTNGNITFNINYPSDAVSKKYKIGDSGAYQDYMGTTAVVHTFSNAGVTGRVGPTQTQINTAYSSTNLAGSVTVNNGIQTWTVPYTGIYRIEAFGAAGGSATSYTSYPGRGAAMKGDFQLTAGDTLKILVGQKGADANYGGGGGGGTFVTKSDNSPLIVAGGGGGAWQNSNYLTSYSDASITTSGKSYTSGSSSNGSGGGGGLNSNGGNGYGAGGMAFINGGQGGTNSSSYAGAGGFGGGGGAEWTYYGSSGAGGGYSGGNNGTNGNGGSAGYSAGGGGGSFIASAVSNTSSTAAANTGHGYVTISYNPIVQVTDNNTAVYAKGQDAAGNWSQEANYLVTNIDRQSPLGSFVINKKADGTSSTYANVSPLVLSITAQDDRSQTSKLKVYISNTNTAPLSSSSGWINYPANGLYNFPYSGADGLVNIYLWFKDEAGNVSSAAVGSITFDKTPISGNVTINSGAEKANKRSVVLTLTKSYNQAVDYANVSKVVISNKQDMSESQTFDYKDDINWTLESDGTKTVYVKYEDWAGNTTSAAFSDAIICDTTGPTGEITINGGASTTSQGNVMLTIIANDELSPLSGKMMLSNRQDFKGAVWENFVNTKNSWPIDSAVAGVKTVYLKISDNLGNESVVSASINFATSVTAGTGVTGTTGGTSGTGNSGNAGLISYSFLNTVQHYQSIALGDGSTVLVTGPNSPTTALSDSQAASLRSKNVLFDKDRANFSLRFEVTPDNAALIRDMVIDLDFNNLNQEGITFIIEQAELKQYRNNEYRTIKYLTSDLQYNGRNRYLIPLGNDVGGTPMIAANRTMGNKYSVDYIVKVVAKKTLEEFSDTAVEILNKAQIKIYTGEGLYTEFIEPLRPSKQFDIKTKVSRAVR